MITKNSTNLQPLSWQQELAASVTDPRQLWELLALPKDLLAGAKQATQKFSLKVPKCFIKLMEHGNISDPLLRQVLPHPRELESVPNFNADPVGDQAATLLPGLLNKYPSRTLLITSPACAVHCRYCFRRTFAYQALQNWPKILKYLDTATALQEVILSGGDPLSLDDTSLLQLITNLDQISHIKRLRIHTRFPILIPQRITQALLDILAQTRLVPIIVVQVNHPQELSTDVITALQRLRQISVILNQSVLLKGVNDNLATLIQLSEGLVAAGVIPYYIHLLDRVEGSAHFEVAEAYAINLLQTLRLHISGYLVPRLAREIPGYSAKMVIV